MANGTSGEDVHRSILLALNRQGFLLQQRVQQEIEQGGSESRHGWLVENAEYPVTARNGKLTRIDLVLSHTQDDLDGCYLSIECKRSHPNYKAWVFFGSGQIAPKQNQSCCYIETYSKEKKPSPPGGMKQSWSIKCASWPPEDFPAFSYYLEARLSENKKPSQTNTIEDAFTQAVYGMTGLQDKLRQLGHSKVLKLCVVPVVVTTARLFRAVFDDPDVVLDRGELESDNLHVEELPFLAVNYHPSDDLALSLHDLDPKEKCETIVQNLLRCQVRTVFVAQAEKTNDFLHKLADLLCQGL